MRLEKQVVDLTLEQPVLVVDGTVLFLIDRLELGVKETEYRIGESLAFDFRPVAQAVGGQVDLVDGFLVPGMGVDGLAPHIAVGPVHFIGNGESRRSGGDLVDALVDLTSRRLVVLTRALLVQLGDFIQKDLFLLEVDRAERARSLEEQMFEVVGQAGVGFRIMLAPCTGYDFCIESGLFVIGAKVNGETVLEGVFDDLHGRSFVFARGFAVSRRGAGKGGKGRAGQPNNGGAIGK